MLRMRTHTSFQWFWQQHALRHSFLPIHMHAKASCTWVRVVEIATNPFGYRVHAVVVLKHYAPDKNQATTTRYHHISDLNFNWETLVTYGSGIRTSTRYTRNDLSINQYYSMITL
jgi:hypothetical protein